MNNDGTPAYATGGFIPTNLAATADHPMVSMGGCPYAHGVLEPGAYGLFRNDTGRRIGPDDWHLLTYIGPTVERVYTTAEVRTIGEGVARRLLDELTGGAFRHVDEDRTVPAGPPDEPGPDA